MMFRPTPKPFMTAIIAKTIPTAIKMYSIVVARVPYARNLENLSFTTISAAVKTS
jgi:hypothetical protein